MENQTIIRSLGGDTNGMPFTKAFLVFVVVCFVGGFLGYAISKAKGGITTKNQSKETTQKDSTSTTSVGINDKKTFKDSAEGLLKEGGIDGEGNFHLERPGGESQNVYLTSSTVDLSKYIGKKVRVQGATFKGEKAGWLMDVGLVEPLQ